MNIFRFCYTNYTKSLATDTIAVAVTHIKIIHSYIYKRNKYNEINKSGQFFEYCSDIITILEIIATNITRAIKKDGTNFSYFYINTKKINIKTTRSENIFLIILVKFYQPF